MFWQTRELQIDLLTDGHTLLWRCEDASKKGLGKQKMMIYGQNNTPLIFTKLYFRAPALEPSHRYVNSRIQLNKYIPHGYNRCVLVRGYLKPNLHIVASVLIFLAVLYFKYSFPVHSQCIKLSQKISKIHVLTNVDGPTDRRTRPSRIPVSKPA